MNTVTSSHKLWITRDRKRLVPDGDPSAGSLFVRKGQSFPASRLAIFLNSAEFFPQAAGASPIPAKEPKKRAK